MEELIDSLRPRRDFGERSFVTKLGLDEVDLTSLTVAFSCFLGGFFFVDDFGVDFAPSVDISRSFSLLLPKRLSPHFDLLGVDLPDTAFAVSVHEEAVLDVDAAC